MKINEPIVTDLRQLVTDLRQLVTKPQRLPIIESNTLINRFCDQLPIDLRSIRISKTLNEYEWRCAVKLLKRAGLVKPNSTSIQLITGNKTELKQKLTNYLTNLALVK